MRAKFLREVAAARLPNGPGPSVPVFDSDLMRLPPVVRRYMRFMGVVGRPRVWSFRVRWTGRFRMAADRPWMACEAWQYNTCLEIARIFYMRVRFGGIVPLLVRDTYLHGQGRMHGRLLDTFNVVDGWGYKIDTGELVTYLNDAILFAPSMLLGPEVTWKAVDDTCFEVTLTDHERVVTGRVFVDERGAVTDFSTTDRYGNDPAHPKDVVRARWSTPVRGWRFVDGRAQPTGGKAIWHFPSGDLEYADFYVADGDVELDVAPACSACASAHGLRLPHCR